MLDSHACGHLNAGFNDSFVHVAAQFLEARFHRSHETFGRSHVNPSRMQLRHIHERSAARCNLLLPEFTDIEFPIADSRKSLVAIPRNAGERCGCTFCSAETADHAGQASVCTDAEGIHLRKIHREQRDLRPIRPSGQRLRIFNKSLQVKIAIGVAIHNQEPTAVALIINTLERPRRPKDIG